MGRKERRQAAKQARRKARTGAANFDAGQFFNAAEQAFKAGDLKQAGDLLAALRRNLPAEPSVLHFSGLVALKAGEFAAAADFLGKALKALGSPSPDLLGLYGLALSRAGRSDDSIDVYEEAIRLDAGDPDLRFNYGNALKRAGRLAEAADAFSEAARLDPRLADAHFNRGHVLDDLRCFSEAAEAYRDVLALLPGSSEGRLALARSLVKSGDLDAADEEFRKVLENGCEDASAYVSYGNLAVKLGRRGDGEAAFRRALEIDPSRVDLYGNIAYIRKYSAGDADIGAMRGILHRGGLAPLQEINLSFALGKALDDAGQYDEAFEAFEAGGKRHLSLRPHDPSVAEDAVARLVETFDAALIARGGGWGTSSDLPIFVLGMPRSGTTLIEQILASHSQVFGAGERDDLYRISLEKGRDGTCLVDGHFDAERLDAGYCRDVGEALVEALGELSPGTPRIVDKMPRNFLYIGLIALTLPNARIIHCMRDPVDTCLSCFMQLFGADDMGYSFDLTTLGRYFGLYARLMDHWRDVLPVGRILDVVYEDVIADSEKQTRRLLEHCGLAWEDACLDFHQTERVVDTASLAQVRQPIYSTSVARWRRYEKHLGPLVDALAEAGFEA